jgi:hypothetical protein
MSSRAPAVLGAGDQGAQGSRPVSKPSFFDQPPQRRMLRRAAPQAWQQAYSITLLFKTRLRYASMASTRCSWRGHPPARLPGRRDKQSKEGDVPVCGGTPSQEERRRDRGSGCARPRKGFDVPPGMRRAVPLFPKELQEGRLVNVVMLTMPVAMTAAMGMTIVILAATRHRCRRSGYGSCFWLTPGDACSAGRPQPGGLMRSVWDPGRPQAGVFQPLHLSLARGKG